MGLHADQSFRHDEPIVAKINQASATECLGKLMLNQSGKRWEGRDKWATLFGASYPVIPNCAITVVSSSAISFTMDGEAFPIPATTPFRLPPCENLNRIFLSGAADIFVLVTFMASRKPA